MRTPKFSKVENLKKLLVRARNKYRDRIALASSFGAEDVVLMDMWLKVNPKGRIFTLDTKKLPRETLDLMNRISKKYSAKIDVFEPDAGETEKMEKKHGPGLFYKSVKLRKLCCEVRKVKPLSRALSGLDAWICGLRRGQSPTRESLKKMEHETRVLNHKRRRIVKINPLVDWTEKEIWSYIRKNGLLYNQLHDKNYPSIGCEPCTRPVRPGEDIRAGRWWWEHPKQKECGLHVMRKERGKAEKRTSEKGRDQ